MESKVQHDAVDAYEALVQFLYRAPIGLAQTSLDGTVDMLNPMASRLLMRRAWTTCSTCSRPWRRIWRRWSRHFSNRPA
jgi:hypothetical protein